MAPFRRASSAFPFVALTLAATLAFSPNAARATPVSGTTSCDRASYPSALWTQCEAQNYALTSQNATQHLGLTLGVAAATAAYQRARLAALVADPERHPNPNTCTTIATCPIDPRLTSWGNGAGVVAPVLYTSRSGGTIAGDVWATRAGPAKRPGIVIINGSVIGFEPIYRFAAQALAKAGFVVMTFDPQGEGNSDQFGEAPDALEDAFAGTPGLGLLGPTPAAGPGLGGNGLPFYDGGEDALDFFLSTPAHPYSPVASRSSGTSHAAKQTRRVAANLDSAYDPLWTLLDGSRIGIAGHSYGAEAASWLAQADPRVTTAVAWDELCVPVAPSPDEFSALANAPVNRIAGQVGVPAIYGLPTECFGAPAGPAPRIAKPALSLTSDYFLVPVPYAAPPAPLGKMQASLAYTAAGVDTGSIVIRGGTHYEYDDVPTTFPATLRGIDMVTWYTTAWFAKYLQRDPRADAMLLTSRWNNDATAAAIDPARDGSLYSWHYPSRLDVRLRDGRRFDCENLRASCAGQTAAATDGGPPSYSFLSVDTSPD